MNREEERWMRSFSNTLFASCGKSTTKKRRARRKKRKNLRALRFFVVDFHLIITRPPRDQSPHARKFRDDTSPRPSTAERRTRRASSPAPRKNSCRRLPTTTT